MPRVSIVKFLQISRLIGIAGLLLGATLVAHAENFDAGVFEFQKKMADIGNAQAQFKLGHMYETGRGVDFDMNAATQWYEKASASGFKPAKNRLVYLQVKRGGFKPEHKAWLNEVKSDADAGDGEASMMLGEMYEQGVGVPKNLGQAQAEYKRAAVKDIAGSESAHYAVTDLINRQKNQTQQEDESRLLAERARKEAAERKRQLEQEQQKQVQLKTEAERKQEDDRRRAEALKRMQEDQRENSVTAQKQKPVEAAAVAATATKASAEPAKPAEGFETDLCSGKAASFRTQCR